MAETIEKDHSAAAPANCVLSEEKFSDATMKNLAKKRATALTCFQRHPGLCRTADRGIVKSSKELAAEL